MEHVWRMLAINKINKKILIVLYLFRVGSKEMVGF